jgi:hypothetical protein
MSLIHLMNYIQNIHFQNQLYNSKFLAVEYVVYIGCFGRIPEK